MRVMEPSARRESGDAAASPSSADVIARHQAGLWRYLRHLGCSPDDADELMQETFVVALRKPFVVHGDCATAGYLRTIARNLFLNLRRGRRRDAARFCDAVDVLWRDRGADGDATGRGSRHEALAACVESLDGRARRLVSRFYADGASRCELAAELGMKETGVKTLLQRVRAALRECVEARLGRSPEHGGADR
ncbi:MAG: sigma-70 family RNA polymerase sigma factor [Planctomycetes bacterium]|nr:sigma-70 family RNA polymerase sigma factor [Planctomycetota bacterium]